MLPILPLVALSAFVYATVILLVVFVKRSPFVVWSVWLYRLLLAAYPTSFREEYGSAMVQVFRDTARAEHRRRGLRGLLVVWLWTLMDFTASVFRQHGEKIAAIKAESESQGLHHVLRQWGSFLRQGGQFGCAAVAVTTLSGWYAFYLLRLFSRRTVLFCTVLCVPILGLWVLSFFGGLSDWYGPWTHLKLWNGSMEISHTYEVGEPVPEKQWWEEVERRRQTDPLYADRFIPTAWEFSFISEIPTGRGSQAHFIRPCKNWQLRFPFLLLLLVPLCWAIRSHFRRNAISGAAM